MTPWRRKTALLEPGDHAEDALLLAEGQVGLEADEVVRAPLPVLRAQLNDSPRAKRR